MAVFVLSSLPRTAWADDVDVAISGAVLPPQKPTLTLRLNKDVKEATLQLRSSLGDTFTDTRRGQSQGSEVVFTLPQKKPGVANWKGTLAVTFADGGSGSMPLAFQTSVLSNFRYQVSNVDLAKHQLQIVSEHDTASIEIEVYGENDRLLANQKLPIDNVKAGKPILVAWTQDKEGVILRIHLVVTDPNTLNQSSDLFPYSISIPHEEVEFDSGKDVIRATEEPKLQKARGEIDAAIARYGTAVKVEGVRIKLFVGGHTDTVGAAASNQALSQRRALSIAKWFAKAGVPVDVYARGFGESVLKEATPDETDNQKNRRVDYDIGVDGPTGGVAGWTRVK